MPIDLQASLSGSGPIGSEKWFHTKAGNPLHTTSDGAVFLRSGNILVGASATYPDVFAKFKISQATAWVAITSFTSSIIYFVEYLNSQWWAGGAAGALFKSDDGLTWTAVTHPMGSVIISGMAYGNGTYVATIGTAGTQTMFSLDGVNWNKSVAYTSGTFNAICFVAGWFMAVGNAARAMRSADGNTWIAVTTPLSTSYNWSAIATDGERFRAVSLNAAAVYGANDPTVTAWPVTSSLPLGTGPLDIEYGDEHWVVGLPNHLVAISFDGSDFTKSYNVIDATGGNIIDVTYGAGFFVCTDAAGNSVKMTLNASHVPTFGARIATLVASSGAYGEGNFILAPTTAAALKISVGDSVGIPNESSLAGGDVIKYMRVK